MRREIPSAPGIHTYWRNVAPMDDTRLVNYEQRPLGGSVRLAIDAVKARYTTPFGSKSASSGKYWLPVPADSRMTPGAVNGDAKQFRSQLLELRENFIVKPHLVTTNGTPVGRVEGENNRSPAEVA